MRCPNCYSDRLTRPTKGPHSWRGPVDVAGVTYRVHRCRECGHIFLSQQTAVFPAKAAWLLEHVFEPQMPSSDEMPQPEA